MLALAPGASADSILAKINNQIITQFDLEQKIEILGSTQGAMFKNDTDKARLVESMVDLILLDEFCKKQKLVIDEQEANMAFTQLAKSNGMTPEQFDEVLTRAKINKQAFIEHLRLDLIKSNFLKVFIMPKIKVTKPQLASEKRRIIQEIISSSRVINRAKISEIVLYKDQVEQQSTEYFNALINIVRTHIKEHGFIAAAAKYSHTESREQSGDLGWMNFADMSPLYQSLVENAVSGDVNKDAPDNVIDYIADQAALFLQVDDVVYDTMNTGDISDQMIESMLSAESANQQLQDFVAQLRKKAFVEVIAKPL